MSNFALICILLLKIYLVTCTFPKCENIITASDKHNCAYCHSERMKKECSSACALCNQNGGPNQSGINSNIVNSHSNNNGNGNGNNNGNINSHSNNRGNSANCNSIKPCVPLREASTGFRDRCKSKGIPDNCAEYCRYDLDQKKVMNAFQRKQCDMGLIRPMLFAAANDKDNTYCCTKQGLLDDEYNVCEPFCNPASQNWPQKPEAKYLKCLSYFDDFLNCHWASCRP